MVIRVPGLESLMISLIVFSPDRGENLMKMSSADPLAKPLVNGRPFAKVAFLETSRKPRASPSPKILSLVLDALFAARVEKPNSSTAPHAELKSPAQSVQRTIRVRIKCFTPLVWVWEDHHKHECLP